MNKILEQKLFDEFEFMQRGKTPGEWFFFGIECGDGWYNILHDLLTKIKNICPTSDKVSIQQIKEKYGGLRFYYSYIGGKESFSWKLPFKFNKFTGWRFQKVLRFIRQNMFNHYTTYEAIEKIVAEAENKSYIVCEVCGNPGKLRDYGWMKCLCLKHYNEELGEMNERKSQ